MTARVTNHLKAERARMDEFDEHQPAAPSSNLEGELVITAADLILNLRLDHCLRYNFLLVPQMFDTL